MAPKADQDGAQAPLGAANDGKANDGRANDHGAGEHQIEHREPRRGLHQAYRRARGRAGLEGLAHARRGAAHARPYRRRGRARHLHRALRAGELVCAARAWRRRGIPGARGVFRDEQGDYPAGFYVRNPPQSRHTPGSRPGCTLFVKLWQFDPADRAQLRLDTGSMAARDVKGRHGVRAVALFKDAREDVRLEQWEGGAAIELDPEGGLELLVLAGGFREQGETFAPQSWLRLRSGRISLPARAAMAPASGSRRATCATSRRPQGRGRTPDGTRVPTRKFEKRRRDGRSHIHRRRPMPDALVEKTCTPCRGGIPLLTQEEAERLRAQVPDWDLRDDAHRIERSFRFRNFREALTFVQGVGELAEAQGHHPDISFGWGYPPSLCGRKK